MIGTELYIEKIKKSKINKNSPLELITELDIIKKFETDTGKYMRLLRKRWKHSLHRSLLRI